MLSKNSVPIDKEYLILCPFHPKTDWDNKLIISYFYGQLNGYIFTKYGLFLVSGIHPEEGKEKTKFNSLICEKNRFLRKSIFLINVKIENPHLYNKVGCGKKIKLNLRDRTCKYFLL